MPGAKRRNRYAGDDGKDVEGEAEGHGDGYHAGGADAPVRDGPEADPGRDLGSEAPDGAPPGRGGTHRRDAFALVVQASVR